MRGCVLRVCKGAKWHDVAQQHTAWHSADHSRNNLGEKQMTYPISLPALRALAPPRPLPPSHHPNNPTTLHMISSVVSIATWCISTTSPLSALRPNNSTRRSLLLTKPGRADLRKLELKPVVCVGCWSRFGMWRWQQCGGSSANAAECKVIVGSRWRRAGKGGRK